MSDLKRGSKTLTGEDELEVDKINIVGEGIGCNDDYGTNGEILQKSLTTNELEWATFVIPDDSITESMLQDNIISEDKLKDNSVSEDKIQANAVTNTKIAIQSIDAAQIKANTILGGNIASSTIEGTNIANNTIGDSNLIVNSIGGNKIGDREITGGKIALNTILSENIVTGAITNSEIADGAVNTIKLANDAVTIDKLADGSVTGDNLTAGFSIDSFGDITLRNPSNTQQITFACNNSYAAIANRTSGLGSTTIGPTQQIGLIIDDPPTVGTYKKGLIYCNAQEIIIPGNAGTGWYPLQVKTSAGVAGDKFYIDIDGNLFTALKVSCNNIDVDGGNCIIQSNGDITAHSLVLNNCDIDAGGNITGNSLELNNTTINANGNLETKNITMSANSGIINFGSITNSEIRGSSHTSKTQQTNMLFASTSNLWRNLNFESETTQTYLIGSTYPSQPTIVTYLDLRSTTNLFPDEPLPYRCYEESGQVYLAINSGDWRPNDDHTYFNIGIVDSNSTYRGRAQVDSSTLEACAMILVPDGWEATHLKIYGTSLRYIEAYEVSNTNSTGSITFLSSGIKYTNNEYQLSASDGTPTTFSGRKDYSLLLIVKPTSTTDYISGGYLKIQKITVSQGK